MSHLRGNVLASDWLQSQQHIFEQGEGVLHMHTGSNHKPESASDSTVPSLRLSAAASLAVRPDRPLLVEEDSSHNRTMAMNVEHPSPNASKPTAPRMYVAQAPGRPCA